jgi:hypothetical protein
MKIIFPSILLSLIIIGCQDPATTENSLNQIKLQTNKSSYSKLDSINIVLHNKSDSDILISLRCGNYLEMFYQIKEINVWSDNLWFWYMSLRCETVIDTIGQNSVFNYSIKSEIFDSTGTYRLVLEYYKQIEDTKIIKYSNSFEIQ